MTATRLRLERTHDRIRIVGPRKGLVLVPGEDDTIRWRSERPVRDWRRHFTMRRRDLAAVDEALSEHGLRLCTPGEWPQAIAAAEAAP